MEEKIKALLNKHKAILCCSHDQLTAEIIEAIAEYLQGYIEKK